MQNRGIAELDYSGTKSAQLRERTYNFAVRVVKMFQALPKRSDAYVLGKQVLRSGTSVAANYRAACRARSKPEFIARIGIVAEEADETVMWFELLGHCGIVKAERLEALIKEAKELTAIFTASQDTARKGNSAITQFCNSEIRKRG